MNALRCFSTRACLAFTTTLCLALSSCWMPAFDPAVSLSVEMDDFFEEHGEPAWRRVYELAVGDDDQWLASVEFLPKRDGSPGGLLLQRSFNAFKLVNIINTGFEWRIDEYWQFMADMPLGSRALLEPIMVGSMPGILAFTDSEEGPWYLQAYTSAMPLSIGPNPINLEFIFDPERLLGFGTIGTTSGNDPVLHILTIDPITNITKSYSGEVISGAVSFAESTGGVFAPGAISPGFAISEAGGPVHAEFDRDGPELWSWDPIGNAARKTASIDAPVSGAFRAPSLGLGIGLLAEGTLYTDIYESSGTHHGYLPTGAWRFAFDWWDGLPNNRWLMVFTRVLRIREGDKSIRLIIQVEAVPTQALLDFAKD